MPFSPSKKYELFGGGRRALSTSLKKRSDSVVNLHKTLLSVILVLTLIVCDFQTLNTLEMLRSGRADGSSETKTECRRS